MTHTFQVSACYISASLLWWELQPNLPEKQFLFLLFFLFLSLFYPLVSCYLGGINDVERRSFISLIGILFFFFFFCGKKETEFRRNPG
jgi:hypothetical protein